MLYLKWFLYGRRNAKAVLDGCHNITECLSFEANFHKTFLKDKNRRKWLATSLHRLVLQRCKAFVGDSAKYKPSTAAVAASALMENSSL